MEVEEPWGLLTTVCLLESPLPARYFLRDERREEKGVVRLVEGRQRSPWRQGRGCIAEYPGMHRRGRLVLLRSAWCSVGETERSLIPLHIDCRFLSSAVHEELTLLQSGMDLATSCITLTQYNWQASLWPDGGQPTKHLINTYGVGQEF